MNIVAVERIEAYNLWIHYPDPLNLVSKLWFKNGWSVKTNFRLISTPCFRTWAAPSLPLNIISKYPCNIGTTHGTQICVCLFSFCWLLCRNSFPCSLVRESKLYYVYVHESWADPVTGTLRSRTVPANNSS